MASVWQEDRYLDGAVPEEEAHDQFLEPELSRPKASALDPPDGVVRAWSGAAAPASGTWLLESHPTIGQVRERGQRMAFLHAGAVRWILLPPDA